MTNAMVPPYQGDSPVIDVPMVLDDEALKPSPPSGSLAAKLAAGRPASQVVAEATPRRRGRPPGSKNKPKVPPSDRPLPKEGELTSDQKRQHKQARAERLAEQVNETINDNIPMVLMSLGMPANLLYKPGQEPRASSQSSKYTDFAMSLMMPDLTTKSIGKFLAEMETTDIGGRLSNVATDGKGPMIAYGLMSAAGLIQWAKTVKESIDRLKPILDAYQAEQRVREQQKQTQEQATGGRL